MSDKWQVWSKQYVFFAPRHWTSGPIAVVFEQASRNMAAEIYPRYRVWSMERIYPFCGEVRRVPATYADISTIVGRGLLKSFPGTGRLNTIDPIHFALWLLGGEWTGFLDEMLFQLDWFLPAAPPSPEYFSKMQTRMNFRHATFLDLKRSPLQEKEQDANP